MTDSTYADLQSALQSARRVIAFDSRDWGATSTDAWLWGLFFGWSDDDGTGDGAMPEMAAKHSWSSADVERLRTLHAAVVAHQTAPPDWESTAALLEAYGVVIADLQRVEEERDQLADRLAHLARTEVPEPFAVALHNGGWLTPEEADTLRAERDEARHERDLWRGEHATALGVIETLKDGQDPDRLADRLLRALGDRDILWRARNEAEAERDAMRAAAHIADPEDLTDWQRGYRACSRKVLAAADTIRESRITTPAETERDQALGFLAETRRHSVSLGEQLTASEAERDELRALFDLQWTRMQAAGALWREESPAERANVWPDLGELLDWFMRRDASAQPVIEAAEAWHEGATRPWTARDAGEAHLAELELDRLADGLGEAVLAYAESRPAGTAPGGGLGHIYLSTACYHGNHADCATGGKRWDGTTKIPATCKYCQAPCRCTECDHDATRAYHEAACGE